MRIRAAITVALTAAAFAILMAMPAFAAGTTQLSGVQTVFDSASPVTSCPETGTVDPVYEMAGSLVGCWYTDTFVVRSENPGGGFRASGTEHFVGCINTNGNSTCDAGEPFGRFDTTFTFTAKFAPTGAEIHGRCHHPIVSGSGEFLGASGVLSFKDIPSEGRFPYHGNVKL